jgi:hypothetical protein
MKKLLLILLCLPMIGFGQSFYISSPVGQIEPDESLFLEIKGAIFSKLLQLEKEETKNQEKSTYTITPIITKAARYGKPGKGYIAFYESESNTLLLKSKSVKGMRNMFHGFEHPYTLLFNRIIKKQLSGLIKEIEQMNIPIRKAAVIKEKEQVNNKDKYERLLKLAKLRDDGILTEEEFNKEKKKILNDE